MKTLSSFAIGLALAGPVLAGTSRGIGETEPIAAALPLAGADWSGRAADNVCGLSDFRTLSNPAVVDFDELVKGTPEMKRVESEGIDPDSPQGIQLRSQAQTRVTQACESVRKLRSHCSVWRSIKHAKNEKAADITKYVLAKL